MRVESEEHERSGTSYGKGEWHVCEHQLRSTTPESFSLDAQVSLSLRWVATVYFRLRG